MAGAKSTAAMMRATMGPLNVTPVSPAV